MPRSYRFLTIPAGADVIPYQSRHGVIIERRNVMHWLDGTLPTEELFLEPPRHTLFVEQLRAQASLPLCRAVPPRGRRTPPPSQPSSARRCFLAPPIAPTSSPRPRHLPAPPARR